MSLIFGLLVRLVAWFQLKFSEIVGKELISTREPTLTVRASVKSTKS